MTLIDYRGFRVVAMTVLPISPDTLVYGSVDGGKTVVNKDPHFNGEKVCSFFLTFISAHDKSFQNTKSERTLGRGK